jgi:hypothetical protein
MVRRTYSRRSGVALVIAMVFLAVFSALAVALASLSASNVESAANKVRTDSAYMAAESGLEYSKYLVSDFIASGKLPSTSNNTVSDAEADNAWTEFCKYLRSMTHGGHGMMGCTHTCNGVGNGHRIYTAWVNYGSTGSFATRFYRLDGDPRTIYIESTGIDGQASRVITMRFVIKKDAKVLRYAIATRSRMWITGDSTIHGDVFSAWNLSKNQLTQIAANPDKLATFSAPSISPFNLTSDSSVEGSINTCWSKDQIKGKGWQLETLDADGNPVYDSSGNKVISSDDEIQGSCDGINYGVPPQNIPGMDISDYDTTTYYNATRTANGGNGDISYSGSAAQYTGNDASLATLAATNGTKWRYERFPHDATNYTTGSGIQVKRYIYKNQTFSNVRLPTDKNALFINCTFNNVLYVDAGKTTSAYNNVRFDNCTFNGTIVSNTPQTFNWQKNTLYFTGSATFQNSTSTEATILAPHFNVNLGNTNPVAGTENVLRGAIVGGIVDVRGNAEVFGTIISMADTSSYTSGYVTNIGATLSDGGSETVSIGDVGTINITPDQEKLLPSGITTPIVIKADQTTYTEQGL